MEQTNQNQQFHCTGDCLNCRAVNDRKIQWQYCAAQFTYNSMRMIETMQGALSAMQGTINELKDKIEAIQNSEATVFDPSQETLLPKSVSVAENTAQSGDGAENRCPETI